MQTERENKDRAERKRDCSSIGQVAVRTNPPLRTVVTVQHSLRAFACGPGSIDNLRAPPSLKVVLAPNKCACATCATMEEMGHSPGCTTAAEKESREELSLPNNNAAGSPPSKRQPTAPQPQSSLKGSSHPSDGGGRLDVLARLEAMAAFDLAPGERVRDLILSEYLEMADIISEFLGTRNFFLCVKKCLNKHGRFPEKARLVASATSSRGTSTATSGRSRRWRSKILD